MGGTCSTHGEIQNAYKILVLKPKGRIPVGRRRLRWEDNIKMGLREIGFGVMDWICLALVNTVMNLRVP
jgi:hypothetical protein